MSDVMQMRRAQPGHELVLTDRYRKLIADTDELNAQVAAAIKAEDRHAEAVARLERAERAIQLRDLWGPWCPQGRQWNAWLWEDVKRARALAQVLARRIGDSNLEGRLLGPHPRLTALTDVPW